MFAKYIVEFGDPKGKREVVPFTVCGDTCDEVADSLTEIITAYWKKGSWKKKGIALPTEEEVKELIRQDAIKDQLDWIDTVYYLDNFDTIFHDYNSIDERWYRIIDVV